MKNLILAATLLVAMVSCSDDQKHDFNGEAKDLKVTATIGTITRSGEKSFWENGDKLGLYVTKGTPGDPYNDDAKNINVPFTYEGHKWKSIRITLDDKPATVFAYYPFNEGNADGKAVPVETDSQTDYMFGEGSSTASALTNTNININMQHALTQVVFKMKKTDYTSGEGVLSRVVISNNPPATVLKVNGTMDISTGNLTSTTPGSVSLASTHSITENETSYSAIVMPVSTTVGSDLRVTFTIDGKDLYYVFPAGTAWLAGYRNIYSFTLKDNDLIIGGDDGTGVVIEPWDDSDQGSIPLIPAI